VSQLGGDGFCILHLPQGAKDVADFQEALRAHRAAGRCDLRWIAWPQLLPAPSFEGQHFTRDVDLRNVAVRGSLMLANARIDGGLILGDERVPNVNLNGAIVRGAIQIHASRFDNTLDLNDAAVDGPVTITASHAAPIHIRAVRAHFHGGFTVKAIEIGSLNLAYAEIRQTLVLRGRCLTEGAWNCYEAQLPPAIDVRTCVFTRDVPFRGVVFTSDSTLDLRDATVGQDFVLEGMSVLPREIRVAGAAFTGAVAIKAAFEAPAPRLVAVDHSPHFGGSVEFVNVDLTECLLVGNPIHKMDFSRIVWPQRRGRRVLLDEVALRPGSQRTRRIPLDSLQEAYQLLKKKAGDAGDHALAGDFHYGELEMRRHERGGFRSLLCWEFLYWFASGYGTRPAPAFGWLCVLTVLGGLLYWWSTPDKGFLDALRFSVAVTTLQKREDPSDVGGWVRVVQTILGAVLIALFVLAVRMRLKR